MLGCNQRYLAFLSSLDDPSAGERDLERLARGEFHRLRRSDLDFGAGGGIATSPSGALTRQK
jgi:hypothetical protein